MPIGWKPIFCRLNTCTLAPTEGFSTRQHKNFLTHLGGLGLKLLAKQFPLRQNIIVNRAHVQ